MSQTLETRVIGHEVCPCINATPSTRLQNCKAIAEIQCDQWIGPVQS